MLVILYSCRPLHRFWQINPNPGSKKQISKEQYGGQTARKTNAWPKDHCQPAQSKPYVYTVMILNVMTDFYLIAIPVPLL